MFSGMPHIELTFSGDNSAYKGNVDFMARKIIADGDNSLPTNIKSHKVEQLEIKSGANKLGSGSHFELMAAGDNGGFTIANGASFTICSGAIFNIM